MNFPFNHLHTRCVFFHMTVHKRQQLFNINWKYSKSTCRFFFSSEFTPTAVLDPCKIWVPLLVFQLHVQTTMQHCFRARIRDYEQFSMLLNPSTQKATTAVCISFSTHQDYVLITYFATYTNYKHLLLSVGSYACMEYWSHVPCRDLAFTDGHSILPTEKSVFCETLRHCL
jgi:hypothetical protein